ncbi:MAG: hypothetical protein P4L51_09255 [Puia sp.]|nr:hypothetical protein [Puia sp.]
MTRKNRLYWFAGVAALLSCLTATAGNPPFGRFREIHLGAAVCRTTDSTLVINSGGLERVYRITSRGLRTVVLHGLQGTAQHGNAAEGQSNGRGDGRWRGQAEERPGHLAGGWADEEADWGPALPGKAVLEDLSARIEDDSGFTTKHITVVAEFGYASIGVKLRYILWVYPGSGIRSQLAMRVLDKGRQPIQTGQAIQTGQPIQKGEPLPAQADTADFRNLAVESIPVRSGEKTSLTAFGYYNDTQHRNNDTMPILREERVSRGVFVDWASGLLVRQEKGGLVVVKESHKCVNQPGVGTGGFDIGADGLRVTGAGLAIGDLDTVGYKTCWASWVIPYRGDSTDALLALKEFDRIRYPVRASDRYIMANTWGNSDTSPEGQGQYAAREENVLKEIASQASLGVDVQQIDDGWQGRDYKQWRPAAGASMLSTVKGVQGPPYAIYPNGWSTVKEYAAGKNVKLGLWASWTIPGEDLRWNYDNGGFRYVKLDFSSLDTKHRLDEFMAKVRSFVQYTHNTVRVNWDVTENAPRVGYFYAREFGNVWLENRKPEVPVSVIYKPYGVLRDSWQLAKYLNLNQFQLAIQNVDKINRRLSDAYLYSNEYCTAIALMGSPMFFSLTQFYTDADREKIRKLLSAYKRDRDELFKGYIFPVGDLPDDSSWTGFQDLVPGAATGWLLLFRELRNGKDTQAIRLEYIRNRSIEVTDLLTGKTEELLVDKAGYANFRIDKAADYRFYRYRIRAQR